MKNVDTTSRNSIVDLLESARTDLEQFRKELGHEEVEVHKRYIQLKREILDALKEMKFMVRDNKSMAKEIAEPLQQKLTLLEQQLEPSHNDGDASLLHQLAGIKRLMADIVSYLGSISVFDLSLSRITDRLYRYQIKLGIIKLKFQLGTMQMKDTVLDARHEVVMTMQDLRQYAAQSKEGLEKRWDIFHHEIAEAYEHLQKAFTAK